MKGYKVWLDRKCLPPDVPWEEGFFKGMVASRAFVPIFSREAINHPDKAHHNWASMHPQSPAADPFFLEQRLALELRHLRLMSHIVPILVGDFKKSGTGTYANYWAKKCHPPEV